MSPRAIPGGAARVVVDSDEHDASGRITEDLTVHLEQQDKRMRKGDGILASALPPEYYGPPEARDFLIAWGSTYGPCREAVDTLNSAGGQYAMLHFAQVWPINVLATHEALAHARTIAVVEGNGTGQFAAILKELNAIGKSKKILRYDGLAFTATYIISALQGGDND